MKLTTLIALGLALAASPAAAGSLNLTCQAESGMSLRSPTLRVDATSHVYAVRFGPKGATVNGDLLPGVLKPTGKTRFGSLEAKHLFDIDRTDGGFTYRSGDVFWMGHCKVAEGF